MNGLGLLRKIDGVVMCLYSYVQTILGNAEGQDTASSITKGLTAASGIMVRGKYTTKVCLLCFWPAR